MKFITIILLSTLAFFSCSKNIKEEKMTQANIKKIAISDELSSKEKELFAAYILRTNLKKAFSGEKDLALDSNITIGIAIKNQKEWILKDSIRKVEEQKAAEEAFKKQQQQMQRLRSLVSINIVKKKYSKIDYDSYNIITLSIQNNSDSTIIGIKGTLKLADMFGDKITNLEVKYDKKIKAKERAFDKAYYNYNQFIERDKKLRFTELKKMQIDWEPEIIIFDDGTKLVIEK